MAQLTKAQLLKISEEMETVYADIQDELLINIARHIGADFVTPSGEWEIRKLSDLGMINDESIKIIAKHSKLNQQQVKQILNSVTYNALKDIEPGLQKAQEKGYLTASVATIDQSQAMQNMMALYYDQATDKMNMTNATLLNSAVDTYANVVQDIANEERILNSATGATLSRYTTRQQATRKAMRKMADEGLTGFIDKAGRQWSPEAYVSMIIRTTAHNVNIDAVKTRQEEYGSDLFQVSVHGGARPLCYPYQDKIYSWGSATGGEFEDGAGRIIKYGSFINDTSQDEPAGLFGINCGHHPFPIIPGYSIVHRHYVQPQKENDEEYNQSQQQRALEREIRAKKRQFEIDKVSGATEEQLSADKEAIRDAQTTMRGFIKETGRTRIYSREQVEVATPGARPTAPAPQIQKATVYGGKMTAENLRKAENVLNDYYKEFPEISKVISGTGSAQEANRNAREEFEALRYKQLKEKYDGVISDERLRQRAKQSASQTVGKVNGNVYAFARSATPGTSEESQIRKKYAGIFFNEKYVNNRGTIETDYAKDIASGFHPKKDETVSAIEAIMHHEIGHKLDELTGLTKSAEFWSYYEKVNIDLGKDGIIEALSKYATTNEREFVAEAWAEYKTHTNAGEIAQAIGKMIEDGYKKVK